MTPVVIPIIKLRRRGVPDVTVKRLRDLATTHDDATVTLDADGPDFWRWRGLVAECGVRLPPTAPPTPVPARDRAAWPAWATAIAKLRQDDDAGVGSTVKRLLGLGGVVVKALLAQVGVACGCEARRANWDEIYRY